MGVCINYRFGQRKAYVPKMLDEVQAHALSIANSQAKEVVVPFRVTRSHPYRLMIDIGECETLAFGFGSMKHWIEKSGENYCYEKETLVRIFNPAMLNDEDMMWCSGFCKTQYAKSLVQHKWVADLVALVARRCEFVNVYDEGDYYHTGVLEDAANAISENGKLIDSIGGMIKNSGFSEDNFTKGGETTIKPLPKEVKRYCTWCGNVEAQTGEKCKDCGKKLFGIIEESNDDKKSE